MITQRTLNKSRPISSRLRENCWPGPAPGRWIKLPLTQSTGPDHIEVDPETLQISDGLRSDIARWDAYFAAVLSGWPAAGGFVSERVVKRFVAAGRQLASRLQDEFGASYHVPAHRHERESVRPADRADLARRSL